MNLYYCEKSVATDTIYYYTPDIQNGFTCARLFAGAKSLVLDVYNMKTDKNFINTFNKNMNARVLLGKLISGCAPSEFSNRVQIILWSLFIDD